MILALNGQLIRGVGASCNEGTFYRLNDKGFKVAGHPRHKWATPSPPARIVVKHPKTIWQPSGHCPSRMFFCFLFFFKAQTHPIIGVYPIKGCLKGDFRI